MKKPSGIRSKSVRDRLMICLLILSALGQTGRANASDTADSVYFHIKIDTLGGIYAGRVLKVTYALANSSFDTAVYPVFSDSIEQISGPESYKSSSYAIINGKGRQSQETGFRYLIRFRHSGEAWLPSASVTVGDRTYTAPGCRVSVRPPSVDMTALECQLKVEELENDRAKYHATLICNALPDQNPPLLSINGKTTRPSSNSCSNSGGKKKYVYHYYFSSKGYEVACQELTFGGQPYYVQPQKNKMDRTSSFIVFLMVGGLFEWIWWLAYRYRYRQEKDVALAAFVLERKTLPLIISWAYTHYGASHTLLFISMLSFSLVGTMLYGTGIFVPEFFWFGVALVPLACLLYRSQRRKLDFRSIPTTLDKQAIFERVCKLAETYNWDIDHYGEDCIVAHTNPPLWHISWGEQIFIVFGQGEVWVNSVNDLNKRTSICSFGYNKRNIRRITEALGRR